MGPKRDVIRPNQGVMTRACQAPGCRNAYFIRVPECEIYVNKKFFTFPKDTVLRNKWIEASGCSNITKNSSLCQDHFDEKSYGKYGNRDLYQGAVPKYFKEYDNAVQSGISTPPNPPSRRQLVCQPVSSRAPYHEKPRIVEASDISETVPHQPRGALKDSQELNKPEHEQLNPVDETVSIDSNIRFENVEDSGCMASDLLFGIDPETSTSVNPPKDVTSCLDTSQSSVVSSMSVCRVCLQDSEGQDMVPLASDIIDNDCSVTIMEMINSVSCIEAKNNDGLPTEVCLQCLKLIVSAYQLKLLCESSNVTLRKMLGKNNLENEEQKITEEKMEETNVEETSKESIISSNNQSRNIFCQDCNVSMFKREIRMHMATCKMKRRAVYFSRIQKMLVICQHCNCLCYNAEMREHRKICNKLEPAEHISKNVLDDNMDDQSSDDWYFQNLRQSEEHVKQHYCSYCKESYDRRDALRAHLAKVHPLSRKRLCTICGKILTNQSWRLHQNKHAQFRSHTCDLCNKKFYTAQTLRIHLRTHTREKPYQCPQCPKRFNLKNSLKYHIRTHTGERPYACIICDKRFTISTNMRTHMKVHELINNEDEKTESAAEVRGKGREIKEEKT